MEDVSPLPPHRVREFEGQGKVVEGVREGEGGRGEEVKGGLEGGS